MQTPNSLNTRIQNGQTDRQTDSGNDSIRVKESTFILATPGSCGYRHKLNILLAEVVYSTKSANEFVIKEMLRNRIKFALI